MQHGADANLAVLVDDEEGSELAGVGQSDSRGAYPGGAAGCGR